MSETNPYAPTESGGFPVDSGPIRKVEIRPIELFKRAYQMMGDQYWLFLGITFVGILIGSLVPLGILMGPIMVGIYLCFLDRESGRQVEFGTLFKGFDQFKEAFIAFLVMLALSFAVVVVFGILFAIVMAILMSGGNGEAPSAVGIVLMLMMYALLIFACVAVYIPFIFSFQLIADRKISGMDSVKLSWQGVKKNMGGVIVFMIVNMIISMVLTLMCYVPVFLFMPISLGALFLMYRDIFGPTHHVDPMAATAPMV
tara:strand:- start:340058 stop:340825 length:768 start_codon:yes stop_codon:yes gene_type:complete